jgi:hypothetical protein
MVEHQQPAAIELTQGLPCIVMPQYYPKQHSGKAAGGRQYAVMKS